MRDIQKSIMGNGVLQALMRLAILLAFPIRKALFMSESQDDNRTLDVDQEQINTIIESSFGEDVQCP